MLTFEETKKEFPVKIEKNTAGFPICYMKYGQHWFGVGIGDEIAEWQWQQVYEGNIKNLFWHPKLIWC